MDIAAESLDYCLDVQMSGLYDCWVLRSLISSDSFMSSCLIALRFNSSLVLVDPSRSQCWTHSCSHSACVQCLSASYKLVFSSVFHPLPKTPSPCEWGVSEGWVRVETPQQGWHTVIWGDQDGLLLLPTLWLSHSWFRFSFPCPIILMTFDFKCVSPFPEAHVTCDCHLRTTVMYESR